MIADDAEGEEGSQGTTVLLSEAKKRDSKLEVGDEMLEPMDSIEFGRIAAQKSKASNHSKGFRS